MNDGATLSRSVNNSGTKKNRKGATKPIRNGTGSSAPPARDLVEATGRFLSRLYQKPPLGHAGPADTKDDAGSRDGSSLLLCSHFFPALGLSKPSVDLQSVPPRGYVSGAGAAGAGVSNASAERAVAVAGGSASGLAATGDVGTCSTDVQTPRRSDGSAVMLKNRGNHRGRGGKGKRKGSGGKKGAKLRRAAGVVQGDGT